jgi:hypothetical protein
MGEGKRISPTALHVAKNVLGVVPIYHLVGLYPMLDGGISIESKGTPFFYIDVEPDGTCELMDMTDSEVKPVTRRFPLPDNSSYVIRDLNRALFSLVEDNNLHRVAIERGAQSPSGREQRLESILRSILPYTNIATLSPRIQSDITREFVEMRAAHVGHPSEIVFSTDEVLFYHDEPILVEITSNIGSGYAMRVPEEEAGFDYVVIIPGDRLMNGIKTGETCLRSAMLDPGCLVYHSDMVGENVTATEYTGFLKECCLPEEGLFLTEARSKVPDCDPQ